MSRTARQQSSTGIYHVMLRGINQTQLFYDEEDYHEFLKRLVRYKDECSFKLYAYCLMGNHIHLLIEEGATPLSVVMQKLTLSYSHWFNAKYDRSGFLFQGRYKSKAVQSDAYLLAVIRYIHNNPVEVGESVSAWTSYDEYMGSPDPVQIVNADFVLGMFHENADRARILLADFINAAPSGTEDFLGQNVARKPRDSDAMDMIKELGNLRHCNDLINTEKVERDRILSTLKSKGLSVRQISRLTGINRGVVLKAGKPQTVPNVVNVVSVVK
jgi:REP element-mobilizing transposase RayT